MPSKGEYPLRTKEDIRRTIDARRVQVRQLFGNGLLSKRIASRLSVAESTVKADLSALGLSARDRAKARAEAVPGAGPTAGPTAGPGAPTRPAPGHGPVPKPRGDEARLLPQHDPRAIAGLEIRQRELIRAMANGVTARLQGELNAVIAALNTARAFQAAKRKREAA